MKPSLATRPWEDARGRIGIGGASLRPLVRPAPRLAMFFPLVVLVAVLPGLYALNSWDLTPPSPWWGLRGLVVLDGMVLDQVPAASQIKPVLEARTFRTVAFQPPLYAWLEAIGLRLSFHLDPRATVLPSYVAGALVVVLAYLHGRLWRGPGLGLVAAFLTGFNRNLLVQMQQAGATTLALAGTLAVLLCYGWHLRAGAETSRRAWGWGGAALPGVLGGLGLGLALMAVGGFGLLGLPVVVLHMAYLRAGAPPGERPGHWWLGWRQSPGLAAVALSLAIALVVAAPWHVLMYRSYGLDFLDGLFAPIDPLGGDRPGLMARLIDLAPATLPLGLYAAVRTIRLALTDETENRGVIGGVFWVLWLAVAALAPAVWPAGPRAALSLFLLVPLNLLAAQAITDLANRKIAVRLLTWMAPATAVCVAWWASANLRGGVDDLIHGRSGSATALGLHLALDLLVASVWITRGLERWARRRDDRQRRVLGGFLATVLIVTAASGIREVWFRHRVTDDLLRLRSMILRLDRDRPFELVAVVGPDVSRLTAEGPLPGGRLRFILRSALPHHPQRDLTETDQLLGFAEGQRLVILAGTGQRLSYAIQSRLGLEAIYPGQSGVLDAFATANDPGRPTRR